MKILMTADTVGGVWIYALELARALGRHDIEVVLATMGAPLRAEQQAAAHSIPSLEVYESSFKLEWMSDPWEDVGRAGEWLLELAERVRPDLVHLNGYAHGALCWPVPTLIVGHSCVLSWWQAVKSEPAPRDASERYRQEVQRGLRAANLVVAPSRAMLASLDEHYGPLPCQRVVPNGREPSLFAPDKKEDFIFTAGRLWDDAKNIRALTHVASRLTWPVYIAGGEKNPENVEDKDKAQSSHSLLNGAANVHPLGRLAPNAVASWLSRASIYAMPARYEPFGLSVLEAALSGCALVLGDIPSLREIWQNTALFVPPDHTEALHQALEELMIDAERRRVLAERARQRALEFTPERMAAGYIAAYTEVLTQHANKSEKERFAACAS